MLKVLTGRIICIVTILLMVTGFTFSMGSNENNRTISKTFKKQNTCFSSDQDLEDFSYLEIEEIEDCEDVDGNISLFDTFLICKNNITTLHFLEGKHSISSKTTIDSLKFKREFDIPKWICLKKIII